MQHFWSLLNGLSIPFATLLDLDLGRSGGGYGRIKTAIGHLIKCGIPREKILELQGGAILTPKQFAQMHTWTEYEQLPAWIARLKEYGVYFSEPLDLDMAMLAAYPDA